MSRNMVVIALTLAVLTGIVIGQITAMESQGVAPRVRPPEHRLELVRSFYAGVNDYLDSGNADFLVLLAPDYEDTVALSSEPGSVESLVSRLDDLRASTTRPVFEIEEIHDLGQVIQVRLSTGYPPQIEAGGFVLSNPQPGGSLEFLQVQGGAIVARWGQDDLIPRIALSSSSVFPIGMPAVLEIESALVTLDPGAEWEPDEYGAAWLLVEHGRIVLDRRTGVEVLTEHESWPAPHGFRRISNRSEDHSSFWFVSLSSSPSSPITQRHR